MVCTLAVVTALPETSAFAIVMTSGLLAYFARNSRRSIKLDGKGEPKGARRAKLVKYTAAKLHEKGVLLGIDDLQTNQ